MAEIINWLSAKIQEILNWGTGLITDILNVVMLILPDSPLAFISANDTVKEYMGYVNYFIPVYSIIGTLQTWLVCITLYYVYQVILRWGKVIE